MKKGTHLKAALELLKWSYADLIEKSGVSKPTIVKMANVETMAELESFNLSKINAVIKTIEREGIEFTNRGPLEDDFPVYTTEGATHEEAYIALLNDAYEHLKTIDNPELLIQYADDKVSPPAVNDIYKSMRKDGIKMRQMVKQGNEYLLFPLDEYRYIPAKNFKNRVILIYGDRIANETASVLKGKISIDPVQADIQRNNFNMLWDQLDKPEKSIADERFD